MAGPAGFDLPSCLTLLDAHGVDPQIAAILLPYWEAGMFDGLEEANDKSGK
ncbi:MAG: DUF7697 family protein [Pelagimonas sp.]|uniref:DUF7697 family protein n=1 Tax=Pelagimonas sp. TaxID=2073170 RepID=UPI003D6A8750